MPDDGTALQYITSTWGPSALKASIKNGLGVVHTPVHVNDSILKCSSSKEISQLPVDHSESFVQFMISTVEELGRPLPVKLRFSTSCLPD
ncbi:hypothetical protein TNCV_239841 [Trichonephila clavipes]|nr:hypothetical protein TNCV_239841 [Trichonephila clavipes]